MSFIIDIIIGAVQSILTDATKQEILKLRQTFKSCLGGLIIGAGVFGVPFFVLVVWIAVSLENKEKELWTNISVGDSLFVRSNSVLGIDFYKKGKTRLSEWEQRKIKYAREDTVDFIRVNSVSDKYFFKSKTSFIGICTGLDSTVTQWEING